MSGRKSEYSTFDRMKIESNQSATAGDDTASLTHDENKANGEKSNDTVYNFGNGALEVCVNGPLNILLLCIPFAFISRYAGWNDGFTFVLSMLALAPLAERLGFITEQLAIHTNETIGGLLNATFGNATELIVAIAALYQGLYRLVQLSLLGSILSNMLLVLGTAFFFGGLRTKTQYFGKISSQVNSTLLMLSTCGVMFPTVLTLSGQESTLGELGFSRATSIILFTVYFAFLYFQLSTHKEAYEEKEDHVIAAANKAKAAKSKVGYTNISAQDGVGGRNDTESGLRSQLLGEGEGEKNDDKHEILPAASSEDEDADDDDDDDDEDILGFTNGLIWLGIATLLIAFLSEFISSSIEDGADAIGISAVFLSAIVLPIVGNAAEHAGAVMFAMKGKLDLSLGVAIGSSTQIALLVLPVCVLLGWVSGLDMSLDFGAYESMTLLLAVITVTFAIKDGKSNWLLGFGLVAVYVVIAIGFFADSDDDLN